MTGRTAGICLAVIALQAICTLAWGQATVGSAMPPGLTRDLTKAAHLPPGGADAFPLGCDPVVNVKDGSLLIRIPAGPFILGSDRWPEEGGEAFSVNLRHEYYIAVHEVTNAQYKRFMEATGHRAPDAFDSDGGPEPTWRNGTFPAGQADSPVCGVNWQDAAAYCAWAGLRLPTELEWEKAARSGDARAFPWGDEWDPLRCRNATGERTAAGPIYEHPAGRSPRGIYAMAGNVAEWCVDWYEGAPDYDRYKAGDDAPMLQGTDLRVTRGGGWYEAEFDYMLRTSQRGCCDPTVRKCDVGFRPACTP